MNDLEKNVADIRIKFLELSEREAQQAAKEINQCKNFVVRVDYTLSFEELIAHSNYDRVNPIINARYFPPLNSGRHDLIIKLVRFSKYVNFQTRLESLQLLDLKPIGGYELISLGNQYPNLLKQYSIAALGQCTDSGPSGDIAIITEYDNKRIIGNYTKEGWLNDWCFAVTPI